MTNQYNDIHVHFDWVDDLSVIEFIYDINVILSNEYLLSAYDSILVVQL